MLASHSFVKKITFCSDKNVNETDNFCLLVERLSDNTSREISENMLVTNDQAPI